MKLIEIIKAIILGIVEGITEWLPVSSTGHLILFDEFLSLNVSEEFRALFLVVIQLGAILAVPVLFFDKLNPFGKKKTAEEKRGTWNLWGKVVVGMLPAALIGIPLDDLFEAHLYRYEVVAAALIVYGVAFIVIENRRRASSFRIVDVHELTYRDALVIGAFQVLSLIPLAIFLWTVALESRFVYPFWQLHKNGVLFAFSYLPQTGLILLICLLAWVLCAVMLAAGIGLTLAIWRGAIG